MKTCYTINMSRNLSRDLLWQEENIIRLLWNRAKHRAQQKTIPFEIEIKDIVLPELCPILQIPIVVLRGKGRRPDGPSLDRIENSLGYVRGNVWIISDLANRMKQEATKEQLRTFGKWTETL